MRADLRMGAGQRRKGHLVVGFLSLFAMGFMMFFIFLLELRSTDITGNAIAEEDLVPKAEEDGAPPKLVVEQLEGSENVAIPLTNGPIALNDYTPALVVITSFNGADRSKERQQIITALCQKQNMELMEKYKFDLLISIDSFNPITGFEAPKCGSLNVKVLHHQTVKGSGFSGTPTALVAAHYKFATKEAFRDHSHVIFLEDDLLPAADFISLFIPTSPAFEAFHAEPRRVWCISAWNDMGVSSHASDLNRLFRTDFFPGLGWMTSRKIFVDAIKKKWIDQATTGWDNWMRSNNDGDRVCIAPEVNRVKHISRTGVNVNDPSNAIYGVFSFPPDSVSSGGTYWKLEGGSSDDKYSTILAQRLKSATRVNHYRLQPFDLSSIKGDVLLVYNRPSLDTVLKLIGARPPMIEPRSGYRGVISFRRLSERDSFIFLCDLVHCAHEWLFPQENLIKPAALIVSAARAVSCTETCKSHNLACDEYTQQTIASPPGRACQLLRTHFHCEGGCGHQVGDELPAMVASRSADTFGQCLAGESAVPKCHASHKATRRLCACVKAD